MDIGEHLEELSARIEAHRDLLANMIIAITHHYPDLEIPLSASVMGTYVEAAEQQQMAAYLEELRAIRDLVEPVLVARRAERSGPGISGA